MTTLPRPPLRPAVRAPGQGASAAGTRPRVALVDSGLGLVPTAAAFARLLPQADLVLSMDPTHMPYGALDAETLAARVLATTGAVLADHTVDVVVVACNSASVHALPVLRAALGDGVPVVGTVPAIRPAARAGGPFAVWATEATTGSAYQEGLIAEHAAGTEVHRVACPGLAEAIDAADPVAIDRAVREAVARTPARVEDIVLGCTHYGLAADRIRTRRPGTRTVFDSPEAVARRAVHVLQAARHPQPAGSTETVEQRDPQAVAAGLAAGLAGTPGSGAVLATYLSGEPGDLPKRLRAFPEGRLLLAMERPRFYPGSVSR
ncbi:glutamate racemase [Brevibacterium litoralis]|uniref:glutamate racemase n=1 Tax=Brevibacterium litoralis TaxID=3138935 RepID=UPI0032ECB714